MEITVIDWLTGMRLASTILWMLLGVRMLFYSWAVADQPFDMRQRAWKYWRVSQLLMCFAIAFVFSPAGIIRANGGMADIPYFYIQLVGTTCTSVVAVLCLTALDVSGGKNSRGAWAYTAIMLVSVFYAVTKGLV